MVNGLQRGVIIVPSAFTLGNLFLGIWAIVAASRREFTAAAWLIVWAAVLDTIDGRVARYTKTGSRFGEELDSLVDGISFGVAPALIIYSPTDLVFPPDWVERTAAAIKSNGTTVETVQITGPNGHLNGVLHIGQAGPRIARFLAD